MKTKSTTLGATGCGSHWRLWKVVVSVILSTFFSFYAVAQCDPPTGISVTVLSNSQAQVTWTNPQGTLWINLQYRELPSGSFGPIISLSNSTFVLTGLNSGTDYELRMRSKCAGNTQSVYSTTVPFTTMATNPCGTASIVVGNSTTTSISFSWASIPGATYYRVRKKLTSSASWDPAITTTSTNMTFSSLLPATEYDVQVQTVCTLPVIADWSEIATTETCDPNNLTTITESACDSYTWGLNGQTYTASGTYSYTGSYPNSCPQYFVLNLTITPSAPYPTLACYETATFNSTTCSWDISGSQPAMPPMVNCWDNFVFNTTTCAWDNTGSQPAMPPMVNCWDNFVFNTQSCAWDNTGSQPAMPPMVNCWDNFVFNTTTCAWDNTGSQPAMPPMVNCWDNFVFNTQSCAWDNTGSQPAMPPMVNCWDNFVFNTTTCAWDNTGSQPAMPSMVNCWDNFVFNTTTCVWDNTGSQPAMPPMVNCWDNFVFNQTTCAWDNTGSQPAMPPMVNCWDNFVFNTTTCAWDNTGSQPAMPPMVNCWDNFVFNTTTCAWDNTGSQPAMPPMVNCWDNFVFNTTTCAWDNTGSQPAMPPMVNCWDNFVFNTTTCVWNNTGTQAILPHVLSGSIPTATNNAFPSSTISYRARWGNTGFESVMFTPNNPSPTGINMNPSGTPIWSDGIARKFEYTYNSTTGAANMSIDWNKDNSFGAGETVSSTSATLSGQGFAYLQLWMQGGSVNAPAAGASVTVNNLSINGTGFGTYSANNNIEVIQNFKNGNGLFGDITVAGDVTMLSGTGSGSERPRFWIQLGQPTTIQPTNCWDNFVFNTTTCVWDNTGTQPAQPTLACYETATFNTTSCAWDVTGTQPTQPPVVNCWDNFVFNTTTCVWDNTGSQPAMPPMVNCWDNFVFNTTTCVWDNTGSQPAMPPMVNCWDNFVFNTTTCAWDNTGSQPAMPPMVNCWDNFVFNTQSCAWDNTGSQPAMPPMVNCWDNFVFNTTTCAWDNTGSQPAMPPMVNCWDNFVFNTTTCAWDNTGSQPAMPPMVNCWDNFVFNTTTCAWDNTGSQPAMPPMVNCWDNYVFNTTTCAWDNTGSQPAMPPMVNCWDNFVFNTTTCVWNNTGTQAILPHVLSGSIPTATNNAFPSSTISYRARWGNTGFESVMFTPNNPSPTGINMNPSGTPIWSDGIARKFEYTYNSTTGAANMSIDWNKDNSFGAGETVSSTSATLSGQGFAYLRLYMQGGSVNAPSTGASVTVNNLSINGTGFGTYSANNNIEVIQNFKNGNGLFGDITVAGDVTMLSGTGSGSERPRFWIQLGQPTTIQPTNCWDNFVFNTTTCVWDNTGTQPAQPTLACYETATFNTTSCAWDVTGTQPTQPPVVNCWDNFVFNTTTCVWDNTGSQPAMPPMVNCWDNFVFNTTTCVWDNTGSQPAMPPMVNCWDNFVFNTTTCVWDNTGSQPAMPPMVNCWDNFVFNTTTCAWDNTGSQPAMPPMVNCWDNFVFNTTTCAWDNTGSQPAMPPMVNCWDNFVFNTTTCAWDNTGSQPAMPPMVNCWDNFVFNTTTCAWDNTGSQPAMPPMVNCWDNFVFNTQSCAWDNTGSQPAMPPMVNCWDNFVFNTTTCVWDNTGSQPAMPTGLLCYQSAVFNTGTCAWDIVGTAPYNVTPASACGSYTWNGNTYTTSGMYTHNVLNTNPCGYDVLDLTINPIPMVTAQDFSACPNTTINIAPFVSPAPSMASTFTPSNPYNGPGGMYTYTYVDPSTGCSASATGTITRTNSIAITGLTVTGTTNNTATVVWNVVPGASWYTIRYNNGSGWQYATSSTPSIVLTGLLSGTYYDLEARANCSVLNPGAYLAYSNFTTATTCFPVTNLTATPVAGSNGTKLNVTFTNPNGSGWSLLNYSTSPSGPWTPYSPAIAAGTVLTGLSPNTLYYVRVQAKCNALDYANWVLTTQTTGGAPSKGVTEGVTEANVSAVSVYPNPTRDVLNIEVKSAENASTSLKIFDMSGRLVKQVQANTEVGVNNLVIDLKDLSNGIYTLQVLENEKLVNVTKVYKQD